MEPGARDGSRGERLQKVLAAAGIGSRRRCEELIAAGRVQVNGQVVTRLGTRVDPLRDDIRVDGRPVRPLRPDRFRYVMMHKPVGVVTTLRDPQGRPTVADLLPKGFPRLLPVGRLDRDSSGLLLFTNDGELAAALLHPRYEIPKTYRVTVQGHPSPRALAALRRGVLLEDGPTAPAQVKVLSRDRDTSVLEMVIHEGRKRQVRRMCAAVGHPVVALRRVAFGPLTLGGLPPGAVRELSSREVEALREAVRNGLQSR